MLMCFLKPVKSKACKDMCECSSLFVYIDNVLYSFELL